MVWPPSRPKRQNDADFKQLEEKRTDAYAAQLEAWLRDYLVDQYPQRAAQAWHRDYTSVEAYQKSVEPQRLGWRNVIKPPALVKTGPVQRAPHAPLADLQAEWVSRAAGRPGRRGHLRGAERRHAATNRCRW